VGGRPKLLSEVLYLSGVCGALGLKSAGNSGFMRESGILPKTGNYRKLAGNGVFL